MVEQLLLELNIQEHRLFYVLILMGNVFLKTLANSGNVDLIMGCKLVHGLLEKILLYD